MIPEKFGRSKEEVIGGRNKILISKCEILNKSEFLKFKCSKEIERLCRDRLFFVGGVEFVELGLDL